QTAAHRLTQGRHMLGIGLVIGEAGEMHRRELPEMLQHMPGPDLVAAIRRVGNAVGEEEQFGLHPSPREISGPIRFSTQSGSCCQAAIFSRYFGSSGLTARGTFPSAVRTA